MTRYKVAEIAGASGAVGREFLNVLEERDFPVGELTLLASPRSAGSKIRIPGRGVRGEGRDARVLQGRGDWPLLAGRERLAGVGAGGRQGRRGGHRQLQRLPHGARRPARRPRGEPRRRRQYKARGHHRQPELLDHPDGGRAQARCTTRRAWSAWWSRPTSRSRGTGQKGIDELAQQTARLLNARETEGHCLPHRIAFNVLPHIDRLHGQRLHEGRDEDGQRDAQDHATCPSCASPRPPSACRCSSATPRREPHHPRSRSPPPRRASCSPRRRA